MGDEFGRRFILQRAFVEYAKGVGLDEPFLDQKLELAERLGILVPVARVRYPDAVVRRWEQRKYPQSTLISPVAEAGPELEAASSLRAALELDSIRRSVLPDDRHPLEQVAQAQRSFVTTEFSRSTFQAWETFRTPLYVRNGTEIGGRDGVHTYYHAWQVFLFAAFLRSGATILYDVALTPDPPRTR
jgi:hypothetical protein